MGPNRLGSKKAAPIIDERSDLRSRERAVSIPNDVQSKTHSQMSIRTCRNADGCFRAEVLG